jgi:hypothetical protein
MTLFTLRSEAKNLVVPLFGSLSLSTCGGGASIVAVAIDMTSTKSHQRRAMFRSLTARLFAFSARAA